MTFLQIQNSSEPRIIGTTNGIYQVEIDEKSLLNNKSYKEIDSIFFSPFTDVTNFNNQALNINCSPLHAKLVRRAVLTDFMGFSPYFNGCSYIISEKTIEYLKDFRLDINKINLLPINIKGHESLAYILFIPMIPTESIIFEESCLIDSSNPYKKESIRVKSYQEFMHYQESGAYIDFTKVCIPEKFQGDYILSIQTESNLFFSEELIQFLMNKSISSFEVSNRQTELIFR